MRKLIAISLLVLTAASCSTPTIAGQPLPAKEQAWADVIKASYPHWNAPDYTPIGQ
jgi:hypothetical protein